MNVSAPFFDMAAASAAHLGSGAISDECVIQEDYLDGGCLRRELIISGLYTLQGMA